MTDDTTNPHPHETGTVVYWHESNHFGRIVRSCGCEIFASSHDTLFLNEGDKVEYDVRLTTRTDQQEGYYADNIKPTAGLVKIGEIYERN